VGKQKVLGAAVVANVLEWYDFGLYGYFAPILAGLFFQLRTNSFPDFHLRGFCCRFSCTALGAVVFGHLGDKVSRNRALSTSIMLMAVPTTLLGLLPTYAQVGIAAPHCPDTDSNSAGFLGRRPIRGLSDNSCGECPSRAERACGELE